MANAVSGNSVYIDTTGALDISNDEGVGIVYAVVSSTAASASLTLEDKGSGSGTIDKVVLKVKDADDSGYFDFSERPMIFSNGIEVTAISNCTATIIFTRGRMA